jgi:hypothetical protein
MAQRDLTLNIGAKTKDLNTALGKMRKDVRAATGNVTAMMKQAGTQMTAAFTAPLALFGANAVKTFATFEQSMAKVKAVSGATGEQFSMLEAKARELGATTRFTSTEVAGLMLEFSKLGFTTAEIDQVTASTLALAQATDSDLSQAASVAGATLRGFGLEADQTSRMVDVMAASFSTSALDMDAFSNSMKFLAPVAKAAGVSLEQSTAMLAALANAGIKGSQAGTALRRIFTEMADTGKPAAEAIKQLAAEGIELADAKDEVGRNAMSALLVLTKSTGAIEQLTEQYENSNGAAKKMAAIMDDTTEGAFKRMSSALEAVAISFGQSFAPVANAVANAVAGMASAFSELPGPIRNVLGVLGLLTAAAGPLLLLGPQLLAARMAFITFKSAVIGSRVAMLALNPLFPLVLAGAAALATGYLLLNARTIKASKVNKRLTDRLNQTRAAYKSLSSEIKGKAATESTENLQKRLAELDAQQKENNTTLEAANKGADIYARINGEAADQINMVRGEVARSTNATTEHKQAVAADVKIQQERAIIMQELQDRLDAQADSTEEATGVTDQLTAAQERLNAAMKTGEKLGLDPNQLNVGGLLEKLGEGTDDGSGVQPFASMFRLSDEQIAEADESVNTTMQNAEKRLEDFKRSMLSFGQTLAGGIQNVFSQLAEGGKSFGQIMGDILQQLLIKLASMVAAFAVLTVLTGGSVGTLGSFLKQGFGIPGATPMADGGIVSGPSHILAGEYPGAKSNPEVIAPLSKLKGMMGSSNLSARVSGRDLLFTGNRDSNHARRQYTSTLI